MDIRKKLTFRNIYTVILMAFSVYMLYAAIGVLLNSGVNLKYAATSIEDVRYVHFFAKLLILYIILVISALFVFTKK